MSFKQPGDVTTANNMFDVDSGWSDSILFLLRRVRPLPEVAEVISEHNGIENGLQMRRKWRGGTSLIDLPDGLGRRNVSACYRFSPHLILQFYLN